MKSQKDLPKPLEDLPLPEKDLPLPEKELTSNASESEASEPEKPHRLSRLLLSFLFGFLFVILIVIIGGGSFFLDRSSKPDNQQVVQTQISNTPSPTPKLVTETWNTSDSKTIVGWKKYASSNGYLFEAPSSWKFKIEEGSVLLESPDYKPGEEGFYEGSVFYFHNENTDETSVDKIYHDLSSGPHGYSVENNIPLTIDSDVKAIRYEIYSNDGRSILTQFIKNKILYTFGFDLLTWNGEPVWSEEDLTTYKKIISTFKFADSGSPTIVSSADKFCPNPEGMSYEEALEIAQNSECSEQGTLLQTKQCNPSGTGYWWIDFKPHVPKSGCSPACVVDVEAKKAEINWRCTGLVAPN